MALSTAASELARIKTTFYLRLKPAIYSACKRLVIQHQVYWETGLAMPVCGCNACPRPSPPFSLLTGPGFRDILGSLSSTLPMSSPLLDQRAEELNSGIVIAIPAVSLIFVRQLHCIY